jgi:hypothetical protein
VNNPLSVVVSIEGEEGRRQPKGAPEGCPRFTTRGKRLHLRALAANATTTRLKARLLEQAEEHDRLAPIEENPSYQPR